MLGVPIISLFRAHFSTADDGGTEIVQGLPLQFNADNIEEMAKLY